MMLFAWIAPDQTGHVGPISVQTPFGIAPAVFTSERLAESFVGQAQARADLLNVNVELTTFETTHVLTTLTPRSNN